MTIRFLAQNLVDSAVIAASTTNSQYPVSNIKNDFRTKTYRSTSNSDNLVFDFGTAAPVDHVALVDNWQNGFGVTSVTIEANATDSWGSPAFSTTMTLDETFGVSIKALASEQTYRFWRLVLTSTLGYCEIANVFIGKADTIATNGVGYNWQYVNKDLSRTSTNRYGQKFIDDIGTQKEINNLSFQILDKDEMDVIFNAFDNCRTVKPVFIYFPLESDSLSNNDDRYNGMYYFKSEPIFSNVNSGYYNTVLSLQEAK